jgi:hypothetical protein
VGYLGDAALAIIISPQLNLQQQNPEYLTSGVDPSY